MPVAYFQVKLSVQSKGGEATLIPPHVLEDASYSFVVVKDGADEGIVKVDAADATLKQIEKDADCKKLTAKQLETLQATYPKPKLKKKFRIQTTQPEPGAPATPGTFEVDQAGNKIVDTYQTVRSGFHLIDVRIQPDSNRNS